MSKLCKHEWVVYSTGLCPPTIMLYCEKCELDGFVEDFTQEEWNRAFYAPSSHYRWIDSKRVKEG